MSALDAAGLSYEEARSFAENADPTMREMLAKRTDVAPEILYYLAEDEVDAVRMAIAHNKKTPPQADYLLSEDADPSIRELVAQKIARQAAGQEEGEERNLQLMQETMQRLVSDQLPRVRQVLSESLKDVVDAPSEIILALAKDLEISVAAPVLSSSPVLTDEDLIAIIEDHPIVGALSAIAERPAVSEAVSDAVVGADDMEAITTLLENGSAQIREETLDMLIEKAPDVAAWHSPLSHRPHLPEKAALQLASFVADRVLRVLEERTDLPEPIRADISAQVQQRLSEGASPEKRARFFRQTRFVYEQIEKLYADGTLTEEAIRRAVMRQDRSFVTAALSALSAYRPAAVFGLLGGDDPVPVLALSWKAGLSAEFARLLQEKMTLVPEGAALSPDEDGAYSLPESTMEWDLTLAAEEAEKTVLAYERAKEWEENVDAVGSDDERYWLTADEWEKLFSASFKLKREAALKAEKKDAPADEQKTSWWDDVKE